MKKRPEKRPSLLLSFIPLLVMVILLFFTISIFGSDALEGGSQVVLLTTTAVCSLIAIGVCGIEWRHIEETIAGNIKGVGTALILLLLIGALSGTWMVSGVVPTLICYGLKIIHPTFFLASTCLICALVAVMTGSSWTTIATIGAALMGIGHAQGFGSGWIAGAIISGAYFGDKISPLSDTTVLASSSTGTPLFTHIRYMMMTTIPSFILAVAIFLVAGFAHTGDSSPEQIAVYAETLRSTFRISPWLLLVPLATGVMIARRTPSIITLFLSALLAGLFALLFQPELVAAIGGAPRLGFMSGMKGIMVAFYGRTAIETGNPELNELVATNGMTGMLNTVWLILCAMCFGGAMQGSGMLTAITRFFQRFMRRTLSVVSSTVFSGIFFNICTADQYLSIILTGRIFRDVYEKKGYESRLLSRTTEDSVTVTSVLIPWNSCGMTQATVLGVSTLTYLPYCFFNLISPLMSILFAALGYKIYRTAGPHAAPADTPDTATDAPAADA